MLFALAEALHAHGHTKEACRLVRQLAEEILAHDTNIPCGSVEHSSHHKGTPQTMSGLFIINISKWLLNCLISCGVFPMSLHLHSHLPTFELNTSLAKTWSCLSEYSKYNAVELGLWKVVNSGVPHIRRTTNCSLCRSFAEAEKWDPELHCVKRAEWCFRCHFVFRNQVQEIFDHVFCEQYACQSVISLHRSAGRSRQLSSSISHLSLWHGNDSTTSRQQVTRGPLLNFTKVFKHFGESALCVVFLYCSVIQQIPSA